MTNTPTVDFIKLSFWPCFLGLILSGCALLEPKQEVKKTIKDVPATARKEDASPRQRLVILPFLDDNRDRPQGMRDQSRDEFIHLLNKTKDVIVIDSKDIKLDLKSHVNSNNEYSMVAIAKEAARLGASAVLEGKVIDIQIKKSADEVGVFRTMKTKFECKVRFRIFASRTARELYNVTKTVTVEESNVRVAENVDTDKFLKANPVIIANLLTESFIDFNPAILDTMSKMNWEGRIAVINGDRVYLNVGRISGVNVGDILKVTEDGDEIYDPQTGGYIGKVSGRLKGTLEVVSYFGQDGAVAIIHSGAGFKENDRVELY